jgi:hypothetical protein
MHDAATNVASKSNERVFMMLKMVSARYATEQDADPIRDEMIMFSSM